MRVIVADDEEPARRLLVRLLDELGGVEVVAEASNGLEALTAIGRTQPELILLDIDMPELDGLALAARYAHLPPIVFVTAHDEHALRAFEVGAIDYLLKPVGRERLATTLHRARARTAADPRGFEGLPGAQPGRSARVVVHDRGVIRVFDAAAIDRFHARDKYTAFSVDGAEHLTEEPLLELEQRLRPFGFQRVHRGELVRIAAVRTVTADGREAGLADGQRVRISRRFLPGLRAVLGIG